ncbi:hypothetical protein D3C76_1582100 [compost metagenome]
MPCPATLNKLVSRACPVEGSTVAMEASALMAEAQAARVEASRPRAFQRCRTVSTGWDFSASIRWNKRSSSLSSGSSKRT